MNSATRNDLTIERIMIGISLFLLVSLFYIGKFPWYITFFIITVLNLWDIFCLRRGFSFRYQFRYYGFTCLILFSLLGISSLVAKYFVPQGIDELFQITILVSVSDVCQYLIGVRYGKTKILHGPSPNKTFEGYIGVIPVVIFGWFWVGLWKSLMYIICGVIGDLFVSACKRNLLIKDISSLLGEHGGWLDRVDGIYMALIMSWI